MVLSVGRVVERSCKGPHAESFTVQERWEVRLVESVQSPGPLPLGVTPELVLGPRVVTVVETKSLEEVVEEWGLVPPVQPLREGVVVPVSQFQSRGVSQPPSARGWNRGGRVRE